MNIRTGNGLLTSGRKPRYDKTKPEALNRLSRHGSGGKLSLSPERRIGRNRTENHLTAAG